MTIESFFAHLRDPAPGFRCYRRADPDRRAVHVVAVRHIIGDPADSAAQAEVERLLGDCAGPARELVRRARNMALYRDDESARAAMEFHDPATWTARSREMRETFASLGFEGDDAPPGVASGVVFAALSPSACFAIESRGRHVGAVYCIDRDDWNDEPLAEDLGAFLGHLGEDPARFFYERGCSLRFPDERGEASWIPGCYVADISLDIEQP